MSRLAIVGAILLAFALPAWADEAGGCPTADRWAEKAAPFLLALGPKDNGKSLTVG